VLSALIGCSQDRPSPPSARPPRAVPKSEEAARRLVARVDQALRTPGPARIVIAEEEITSYLAMTLADGPIQDLSVWFTPGEIRLWARLRTRGELRLRAVLTVALQGGDAQVQVHHAALNGRPLPRFLLASFQGAANAALADAHLPLQMEELALGEGSMVIVGTAHRQY